MTLPQLDGESDDEWRQRKTEGFFEEAKYWVIIILVVLAISFIVKMLPDDPRPGFTEPPTQRAGREEW